MSEGSESAEKTIHQQSSLGATTLWFKMEFTGHRNLQGWDFDYHFLHGFGMPEQQFLKS